VNGAFGTLCASSLRESGEVVCSYKESSGLSHGLGIKGLLLAPGEVCEKRIRYRPVDNPIAVCLCGCAIPRVKAIFCSLQSEHRYVTRKRVINPGKKGVLIDSGRQQDTRYLTLGVHACVSSPGTVDLNLGPIVIGYHQGDRFFERPLDGPAVATLPSLEA
jgi:hypothetical protein